MLPTHREPLHPGEILLDFIDGLGMSQTAFAKHLGWHYPKLNEIIKGKRGITCATAVDLSQALGTTPDLWLNMQRDYDLWHTLQQNRKRIELLKAAS